MTDYSIEGVRLLYPQGGVKMGHANPNPGVSVSEQIADWNVTPGEKAQVKVCVFFLCNVGLSPDVVCTHTCTHTHAHNTINMHTHNTHTTHICTQHTHTHTTHTHTTHMHTTHTHTTHTCTQHTYAHTQHTTHAHTQHTHTHNAHTHTTHMFC